MGADVETVVAHVRDYLSTQEDVLAAYLFGSRAQGRARPQSDVDIAVLLREDLDSEARLFRRLSLGDALEQRLGRPVDLVVLNDAPLRLRHQVLRHGKLIFERDREARVEFEVRTGKLYADMKPVYDFYARATLQEIKEGRFGGRK